MAEYKLNTTLENNKVFLVNRSELEGKFEMSYYLPSIRFLEEKIRNKTKKTLRDFIVKMASGATPSVTEEEKYYSNAEDGIPFLRVQNLQTNGKIYLKDVKYINLETHENYLKRSQVNGGDLLIKITGVGRMAIASVAPDNFIGNTNQHMVVIKTGSREISEYLSNYLNLDFVEKLATRRATGGTRPALDYKALKSIPIIENVDFSILKEAEIKKQTKEAEAKALLASIDTYLLGELGITLPEKDNSLQARIFTTNFSEVSGGRLESMFYTKYNKDVINSIENSIYPLASIKSKCKFIPGYAFSSDNYINNSDCYLITIKNISKNTVDLENVTYLPDDYYEIHKRFQIKRDDLLIAMTGATIGKVGIFDSDAKALLNQRNGIIKSDCLNTFYLMNLLNTELFQSIILKNSVGGAQPNISESDITKIKIPFPQLEKQNEIAIHIQNIRSQAKVLQEEANLVLEQAKQQVEEIILR